MPDRRPLVAERKADFGDAYTQPDPRRYFRTLRPLDYQVPQRALPAFRRVVAARAPAAVLDVCCSYGINAALLRTSVSLPSLYSRYASPSVAALSPAAVVEADRSFYASRLVAPSLPVLGVDVSAPAVSYAVSAGLLARGWAEDLESAPPSPSLAAGLRDVGLIVCTGGVGYVGERTFSRLVASTAAPSSLWVAMFVLRVFPVTAIASALARYGLVTEQVPGWTVPQRRFADGAEEAAAVHDVVARGLDPTGLEADGWYYADCFLARPAAAAAAVPVADLLPPPAPDLD